MQVRFFPEVMEFIQEGEKRHPKQKIELGPKGKNGKPTYVDYIVKLPKRSLEEFCRWVYRFMGNAQFISPQVSAVRGEVRLHARRKSKWRHCPISIQT
ncbi:hypothetical protein [Nostoc sp.]|uniref:hypothetical protein n=1 Tax=Nostoc sp. TaxID=1180 RepID=UPI002FF55BD6